MHPWGSTSAVKAVSKIPRPVVIDHDLLVASVTQSAAHKGIGRLFDDLSIDGGAEHVPIASVHGGRGSQ